MSHHGFSFLCGSIKKLWLLKPPVHTNKKAIMTLCKTVLRRFNVHWIYYLDANCNVFKRRTVQLSLRFENSRKFKVLNLKNIIIFLSNFSEVYLTLLYCHRHLCKEQWTNSFKIKQQKYWQHWHWHQKSKTIDNDIVYHVISTIDNIFSEHWTS